MPAHAPDSGSLVDVRTPSLSPTYRFGDVMALPHSWGGLGLGRGQVSLALTIVILGFVGYLAVSRKDVDERAAAHPARGSHRRR
jgi:hypothetical protein